MLQVLMHRSVENVKYSFVQIWLPDLVLTLLQGISEIFLLLDLPGE
jgi:hypothetical protein